MAAASRQWWKVSNPPEVAPRLVCHKAPFLDLCSFSYITVTFNQWHLPAQLCLPMTLSCMIAVLTAQISAVVGFLRTLNASATGLINGTQRLTPANQCTCFSTFANQKLGRRQNWLWVLSRSPSRSEHAILVWCWQPKVDGPCSILDPKAKFSCLCAQTACPASKLGCYCQAPIRRPRSTCPGVRLPCMGWLPKARLCFPRVHSAGSGKSSFTLFTSWRVKHGNASSRWMANAGMAVSASEAVSSVGPAAATWTTKTVWQGAAHSCSALWLLSS